MNRLASKAGTTPARLGRPNPAGGRVVRIVSLSGGCLVFSTHPAKVRSFRHHAIGPFALDGARCFVPENLKERCEHLLPNDNSAFPQLRGRSLGRPDSTCDIRTLSLLIEFSANLLAFPAHGHWDPSIFLRVSGHLFEGT
jgi:hypothetical protein